MTDRRRLWRAENQEISITQNLFGSTYRVEGTRGTIYTVDLEKPSCECPDWQKRTPAGGCKHILKVKLKKGIVDPLRSEKTNTTPRQSRSQSNYSREWKSLSDRTKKRDHWECQRCGDLGGPEGDSTLHAHHILPKSKGGEDQIENLITVCHGCHEQIHGHPIPSPELANWDTSRGDRGSTTHKSDSSTQSTSGKVSMEDYLPETKQAESETQDTYPHSKYNHEAPQARLRGQEDQPDESRLKEDAKNRKSNIESDETQSKTSPHQDSSSSESEQDEGSSTENDDAQVSTSTYQDSPQSRSQDTESYSDETIGIVGTVWACIGLTLACTVVFPPTFTFARWKVGISAAFCALLFMAQLIGNNSIRYVRDFTGFMIFAYVSVTMMVAYLPL